MMKLMIVDDHAGTREMIRQLLEASDFSFCECATGEEAIQRAADFKPDWVTLDIHMNGMNGMNAATQIKKENPASRIIIVTAENHSFFRRMANQAGAAGFVCKENLLELRALLVPNGTEPAARIVP